MHDNEGYAPVGISYKSSRGGNDSFRYDSCHDGSCRREKRKGKERIVSQFVPEGPLTSVTVALVVSAPILARVAPVYL